jgi:hypothetical protein
VVAKNTKLAWGVVVVLPFFLAPVALGVGAGCTPAAFGDEPGGGQSTKGDDDDDDDDNSSTSSTSSTATSHASSTATTRSAPLPEEDAGAEAATPPPCTESGAIQAQGHCYFALSTSQSWDAALAACKAANAHLVTINGAIEQTTVATLLPNQERWIGLRRPHGSLVSDVSYTWSTGEPRSFQDWSTAKKEPDGSCPTCSGGTSAECVRMIADGTWADDACGVSHPALCERD